MSTNTKLFEEKTYEEKHCLDVDTAMYRSSIIEDVEYEVCLALPKGANFFGHTTTKFNLKELPTKTISLDHAGLKISSLTINGTLVENKDGDSQQIFTKHMIFLPTQYLKVGENVITMQLYSKYRNDGEGLHTFTDEVDQQQYLYTQFEVDLCRYVYPCFDQPDIKATWEFKGIIPEDWDVISNEYQNNAKLEAAKGNSSVINELKEIAGVFEATELFNSIANPITFWFNQSARISTYLYVIVAGPYGYHESNVEGMPPMRIYARKSVLNDVDHEDMFLATQTGIKFYTELFGCGYPFNKYDQVFCPEFNAGAMENVGCVTYNEAYLFRGQTKTLTKTAGFCNTNLHELGHMWFGNLVTMKWWNDLWLNESFATYVSYLAQAKFIEFEKYHGITWALFTRYKGWAYRQDGLSSTHAICGEVPTTHDAETIFDGISYGKGSAWLKQTYNVMGYETLKVGLHRYFKLFSWKNTTLPDFVGCLDWAWNQSGNKSMGEDFVFLEWCDQWLKTSGVNILEPIVEYNADFSIKSLHLKQTCDLRGKNRLRKQKLNVALYHGDNLEVHVLRDIVLSDKEALTKVNVDFTGPVRAIFHNYEDHAYLLTRYDARTLEFITSDLHKITSDLERAVVWRQIWIMVQSCKMSSMQYFNFVVNQLPNETSQQIINESLMYLSILISNYIPSEMIGKCREQMFATLMTTLAKTTEQSLIAPMVDQMFSFISSAESVTLAQSWVEKEYIHSAEKPDDKIYDLKSSHLQSICKNLFKSTHMTTEQKNVLLEKVLKDDKSDIAKSVRLYCEVAVNDPAVKAQAWKDIVDPNSSFSMKEKQAKMGGFYSWGQFDICKPYFDMYYEQLKDLDGSFTTKFVEAFLHGMRPTMEITDTHIVKLVTLKGNIPDTNSAYKKQLEESIELLVRAKTLREMALEAKM